MLRVTETNSLKLTIESGEKIRGFVVTLSELDGASICLYRGGDFNVANNVYNNISNIVDMLELANDPEVGRRMQIRNVLPGGPQEG